MIRRAFLPNRPKAPGPLADAPTRPVTIHGATRRVAVQPLPGAYGLWATVRAVALLDDFGSPVAARLVLSADPEPKILGILTLDGPEAISRCVYPFLGFSAQAA